MFDPELTLKEACVAIVGLGLMGGSLGLALREQHLCRKVIGLVRRSEAIEQALTLAIVDEATLDPNIALGQADIVIFSTPIRIIISQLQEYAGLFKPGAIITDMGSTKQAITSTMASLPNGLQPLGSHPMCGKEVGGMAVAEAALFKGAPWVLTPLPRTAPEAVALIDTLAQAIGCRTLTLAAERHDTLVATISHLPYTLAAALVLAANQIARDDGVVWDVAASGFRDTSRVAASETSMMLDILLTNKVAVARLIDLAQQQLDQLGRAIATEDETGLRLLMEQAARQRRKMYQ